MTSVCVFNDEEVFSLGVMIRIYKQQVEKDHFADPDSDNNNYIKTMENIQKITDKIECAPAISNDDWWDGWFTAKKDNYEMYGKSGDDIIQDIEECDALDRNDPDDRDEIKRIFDRFVDFTGEKYDVDKDEVYTV